ncbi:MAG: endospore germination permease [Acetanaerobacterium sp.]
MSNSVTNRQMFFIIVLTLTAYTTIDIPKRMAEAAGRSSWIPILVSCVVFALAAVIITKLNNMFQGKVFFDYSQQIIGKFLTYLIGVCFILYFFIIGIYLKLELVGMLSSNFLPQTPKFVMLAFSIPIFAYVSYKGITNIARLFEICGAMFVIITLGICLLMVSQGMSENVRPFYNPNEAKRFWNEASRFLTPFGGIEVLLIIPFTPINKKAPRVAFFTLIFIGLFYVLIVESTIMMLGVNNTMAYNESFIEAIKIVEAPVIERTDMFYLTFGLLSLFTGMIIVFTLIVEFACKIFSKAKRIIIVVAIGILFYVLTMFSFNAEHIKSVYDSFMPYLVLVFSIFIPTIIFIVAKVKKRIAG